MTQLAREFSDFQIVSTLSAQLPWLAFPEVLWILAALRSFREAPRSFREVFWENVDAVAGHRGALGCDFLARGGIPGCDFLPAEVFRTALCAMGAPFSGVCGIRCRQCSPLFWHLQNSVPEMAFYGTEYACRAQKGFLRYATRFQKPSVLKTGFWGTEGIFGTGKGLLRYATRFQRRETADSADCGQPSAAPDTFSEALISFFPPRMHLRMSCSSKTIP